MTIDAYRDEIRLRLTGGLLDLELDDAALDKVINAALREIQRYNCSTRLATIPFSPCIDLSECKVSSVSRVFRSQGYMAAEGDMQGSWTDPMYIASWQMLGGNGNVGNVSNWAANYGAWNTMLQIRNTASTDLTFRFDKYSKRLYINTAFDKPTNITIEYVPLLESVEDVVSDYWIDMLMRLAVALAKVTVGRIRSRYTQANALWTQDGETILQEGTEELNALREYLQTNTQLVYPID